MRKLDTSYASSTVGQPVKSGTMDHLQLAYQEALTAIGQALIGLDPDLSNYFRLWGCKNSGSGLNYVISAGAIWYNGEVFLVPAASFTAASGQVGVGNFQTTFNGTNADPVLFTDGQSRNVHQIRQLVFSAGTSGSGAVDFSKLQEVRISPLNVQVNPLATTYTLTFEQSRVIFAQNPGASLAIYFDFTGAIPGNCVRMKFTAGAGFTMTVNAGANQTIIKDSGNLSSAASANNLLYAIYLGKNEQGYDEVSYILKQF